MEEKSIDGNPETQSEEAKPKKTRVKKPYGTETEKPIIEAEENSAEENAQEAAREVAPPAAAEGGSAEEAYLGKFKSVDALMRAYRELEAEFTRRSQKLKALEESAPLRDNAEEKRAICDEELYEQVTKNEGVRARVLGDYLNSLKGVPLMTSAGAGVKAPSERPKSIREAGSLALGYLRNQKN